MKFDNERASAWAERFDASRAEGTAGEERAAGVMAEEFARIGLRAETRVVFGSRFPHQVLPVLGWSGLGLGITLAAYFSDRDAPGLLGVMAWVGAMAGWGVATLPGLRFGHGWPPRATSRNVHAERATDGSPPARVVFRTPLDGVVLRSPEVPREASSVNIGALLGCYLLWLLAGWIYEHDVGLPVPGILWILVLVHLFPYMKTARHPGLRDNRTGLAVLLELARTWPRRADARIEAHFVAVGGQGLDGAGSRALDETIRAEWPVKPTLVIDLSAPGVGKGLILAARGHADLAGSAAADLWIPHRPARRHAWTTWTRPVTPLDDHVVWLAGDEAFAQTDRGGATAIDPEALGRAAQLATEIALRWARRVATDSAESR